MQRLSRIFFRMYNMERFWLHSKNLHRDSRTHHDEAADFKQLFVQQRRQHFMDVVDTPTGCILSFLRDLKNV